MEETQGMENIQVHRENPILEVPMGVHSPWGMMLMVVGYLCLLRSKENMSGFCGLWRESSYTSHQTPAVPLTCQISSSLSFLVEML